MKAWKWIILIGLLTLLLMGAAFLHPLVRFTANLYLDRADRVSSVYINAIQGKERLDSKAKAQLQRYAENMLQGYLRCELTYDEAMAVLSPLAGSGLPQADIDRCIQAVMTMETARNDLARADALVAGGDYAQAIPLYRRSLMADDSATYRLQQAEAAYKNSLLQQAESAMAFGQYTMAEGVLTEGLALFAADDDFTRALSDVHRMEEDTAYAAQVEEACRLLQQEGPDAAFQYAASLRQQAPDAYEYDYIEQLVRHQYEEDICARALSLQAGGDPTGAYALLEEGLTRLDSQRMRTLYGEIRPPWSSIWRICPFCETRQLIPELGRKAPSSITKRPTASLQIWAPSHSSSMEDTNLLRVRWPSRRANRLTSIAPPRRFRYTATANCWPNSKTWTRIPRPCPSPSP